MSKLSHFDSAGRPRMVDVGAKTETRRTARAHAFVRMSREVLDALPANPKGDPLGVARVAGVMAAKRTSDLIPLCHSLPLSHADVEITVEANGVRIFRVSRYNRADWSRNGSTDCGIRRSADGLRHDQGARQSASKFRIFICSKKRAARAAIFGARTSRDDSRRGVDNQRWRAPRRTGRRVRAGGCGTHRSGWFYGGGTKGRSR